MSTMLQQKCCCCGKPFKAAATEVRRGWGKYCSRSCKGFMQAKKNRKQADAA